jgi:hypothetical protein
MGGWSLRRNGLLEAHLQVDDHEWLRDYFEALFQLQML